MFSSGMMVMPANNCEGFVAAAALLQGLFLVYARSFREGGQWRLCARGVSEYEMPRITL